jgi:RNA polymerase sigma-70 factor (ECF subfamily)
MVEAASKRGRIVMADETFRELIGRVRRRDDAAAAELARRYEPEIRRIARVRLSNSRLRRLFDSGDVCQSVLGALFVRIVAGQVEVETPADLLRLLVRMTGNKLIDYHRHETTLKRDPGQPLAGSDVLETLAGREPDPGSTAAARELLRVAREQLSEEERFLVEERSAGREWSELAARARATPDALRKRLARALERVATQLGIGSKPSE